MQLSDVKIKSGCMAGTPHLWQGPLATMEASLVWLHNFSTVNERQMDDIIFRTVLKNRVGVAFGIVPLLTNVLITRLIVA